VRFEETYEGLRVLDLSENIAGPLACMVLADLGADVIKVERPVVGEATRSLPPHWAGESTVFLTVNRNKRSVALDLRSDAGREAVLTLAERADVVVESFRPGVADRLGLGFSHLSARNPSLVHCAINAFGTGPLGHDRPGYDALLQAFTGIMAMTGEPDGGPSRAAPSIIDITTGMWAVMSVMAALTRRERMTEPEPQSLEATLIDSGLFLECHQIIGYLGSGSFPGRLGSAAPSASPYQAFSTRSEPIMVATSTDGLYERLCVALGLPELAVDPRFTTMQGRIDDRAALSAVLQERLNGETAEHWLDVLGAAGVPAGPVQDLGAAVAHPLTVERGLIAASEPGRVDGLQQLHLPMDRGRTAPRRQAPAVGEHTEQVLREAGLSEVEIVLLTQPAQRRGTVQTP
jgi:crotonobetainyl-CoA:carnitine CoA-transferase CaiB-like acyl-CoA transferase